MLFSFEGDTDTNTGVFSANVTNTSSIASEAIMTALGINIIDGVFTESGFTFTPGSCTGICEFESGGTGLSGFLSFDISAGRTSGAGGVARGLEVGDSGLFEWEVSFAAGAIDGVADFFDVFETEFIDNTLLFNGDPGTDINAFWIAHMQSVATFDIDDPECVDNGDCSGSLKIGGALNDTNVPEPGALAILSVGLIGLGALVRRRRKAA